MTTDNALLPYQVFSSLQHGHLLGGKPSPTYQSWLSMHTRCRHAARDTQNKYINRGISVCERWNDFKNFLEDMGERLPSTSLDRIDNDGNYEPANCRWATAIEQGRNKRSTKLTYEKALDIAKRMLAGEKTSILAKEYGVSENTPRAIHKGYSWKDAHNAART
jgi:hypothetical protein